MKHPTCCPFIFFTFIIFSPFFSLHAAKIVGLVPARNEAHLLPQCLKALSLYTDAIVYLDDASTDNSVQIVESLQEECNIERIIIKQEWYRDEPGDRNMLLQAGREIGGTHFIVLDADEMFTSNCLDYEYLRSQILALQPGDRLLMVWIQLWRSIHHYRFDNSVWTWNYKDFIFCDDGNCSYASDFIHTGRTPYNLVGKQQIIHGYTWGVLHFQFANWQNLLIKQAWYRCLERVRYPDRSAQEINARYAPSKDETGLKLQPAPRGWFANYSFFDEATILQPESWRQQQVIEWFIEYGISYFIDLDIWDVSWPFEQYINTHPLRNQYPSQLGQDLFVDFFVSKQSTGGTFVDIGAHDGVTLSNTLFLEKQRNWKGLCIEPLPTVYPELCNNRSAVCIEGCIGGQNEITDFIAVEGYAQQLSGIAHSYDPRYKQRLEHEIKQFGGNYQLISTPVYTLNSILEKHTITHIDFLSIDTEGAEIDILTAFNFENCYVKALCVENNYYSPIIKDLLHRKGFQRICVLGDQDEIYINKQPPY